MLEPALRFTGCQGMKGLKLSTIILLSLLVTGIVALTALSMTSGDASVPW